jgi:hypothetical protein
LLFRRPFLVALLSSIAVAGCATGGATFAPHASLPADQGVVYVFRPRAWSMSALTAMIEIDGRTRAALETDTYAAVPLAPGRHTIVQSWKAGLLGNSSLEGKPTFAQVDVVAGQATYVRIGARGAWGVADWQTLRVEWEWELQEVPGPKAPPELAVCRLVALR